MIQVQLNGFSGLTPAQEGVGYNFENAIKVGWKGKVSADFVGGIETLVMGGSGRYRETDGALVFWKAVRNFQAKYGLTVDGKLGPATWTKVLQVLPLVPTPKPDPVPPPAPPAGEEELPQVEEESFLKKNGTALAVTGGVVALLGTAAYLFRSKIGLGGYEDEEDMPMLCNSCGRVLGRVPKKSGLSVNICKKCADEKQACLRSR